MKDKELKITGYTIDGKLITETLEKGESISNERCIVCNSLLVEDYYDAPYRDIRCAICRSSQSLEDFSSKDTIKNMREELTAAKEHVIYLINMINTLQETNDVRKLNANM